VARDVDGLHQESADVVQHSRQESLGYRQAARLARERSRGDAAAGRMLPQAHVGARELQVQPPKRCGEHGRAQSARAEQRDRAAQRVDLLLG
jgi:hypothetical protein